mgnify:CR=1 FL=1
MIDDIPSGPEKESQGVSLQQVFKYVEQALNGDRRLRVQLFRQFQALARQPGVPLPERRLGEVLSMVLIGEREPDLDGLDAQAAKEMIGLLARLAKFG